MPYQRNSDEHFSEKSDLKMCGPKILFPKNLGPKMGDGRGRLAVSGPSNFQSDLKACVVHAASIVGGVQLNSTGARSEPSWFFLDSFSRT